MATRLGKPIPKRSSKIAEDYAKKERMEPPKPTRQDVGLELAEPNGRGIARRVLKAVQAPKSKKYPYGGCSV